MKGNTKHAAITEHIVLSTTQAKYFFNIMLTRMKSTAKELVREAQAGLTEGRRTAEQISNIRFINEKYIEHQKYVYHNFFDFKRLSTEFDMKHFGKKF